jgi:hypothetical protein
MSIHKFQDLKLDREYQVHQYSELFTTTYGESIILLVSKEESDKTFEVYATKLIVQYIKEIKPKRKFTFTVKEHNDKKYPSIEGYNQERKWRSLE